MSDVDSRFGRTNHKLEITMPRNYPFSPPSVRFTSAFNHTCVGLAGQLSLDILGDAWSPAISLGPLIHSIASFINETDIDYMRSRQIKRTHLIKYELISRLFASSMRAVPLP